jgi:peptidoglycan/xylan/chitin deacetylase (PgdA/CDA1 family)
MNARTRLWLDALLRWSPAQPAFRWRNAHRLAVLAYHGIDDPEHFEGHLDYIWRNAHAVEAAEAIAAIEGRRDLPPRAVLITFDDGHRSVLELGLPMLRERGLPAVAFVIAGLVDTDEPFWWDEVRDLHGRGGSVSTMPSLGADELFKTLKRLPDELRREATEELRRTASSQAARTPQLTSADLAAMESGGIEIGNHSWSHPSLSRCSDAVVEREMRDSHVKLTLILGHAPATFAHPYGDRDVRADRFLEELEYAAAFLFDHRMSPPRPSDRFAVSRLQVNASTTNDRFQTIVSGLHPALHRIRRTLSVTTSGPRPQTSS